MRQFLIALACLVVAACSQRAVIEKLTSPEDRAFGSRLVDDLRIGNGSAVIAAIPAEDRAKALAVLPRMMAAMPRGADGSVDLVDARFNISSQLGGASTKTVFMAYAVDRGAQHAVVRLTIQRRGQAVGLASIYVDPLRNSIKDTQRFSLSGKSALQYVVLALALASVATCITALVVLFRTRGVRRKWLWAIGCVLGLGLVVVDWSNGAVGFALLNVQLLGAFVLKQGALASWRVGFGVPVFAIAFLVMRDRLSDQVGPTKPPADGETAAPIA